MAEQKGVKIPLSSGFVVLVKPLPPYYLDFIDQELPLKPYPKRKLRLASGSTIDVDYQPPDELPKAEDKEEYELYLTYRIALQDNVKLTEQRNVIRVDFLVANCVEIISGPIEFDSIDWVNRLEAAFPDYKVPTHAGKRMLAFMKSNVILLPEERNAIVKIACFQEVNLQGIIDALQGFQSNMERPTFVQHNIKQK
jgi:hypothetical protein